MKKSTPDIKKLTKKAFQLSENECFAEAVKLWQQIADLYLESQDWVKYVDTLNNLGNDAFEIPDYQLTLQTYQLALKTGLEKLGNQHELVAHSYNNLGNYHVHQGNFEQSLLLFQKALAIKEKLYLQPHSSVANTYQSLGWNFYNKGDYDRAINFHTHALDIRKQLSSDETASLAVIYNHLGLCYRQKGDYAKASANYEQALGLRIKMYGVQHANVAVSYQNLGLCQVHQFEFKTALAYYKKALDIRLQTLGESHVKTATTHHSIGHCFTELKQYVKGLAHFDKAVELFLAKYGDCHVYLSNVYNNMGMCYLKMEQMENAWMYLHHSYTIRKHLFGEMHPKNVRSLSCIAEYYEKQSEFEQSLHTLQEALRSLLADFDEADVLTNPPSTAANSTITTMDLLFAKGRCFYKNHLKDPQLNQLEPAFKTFELCDQLIDRIRQGYRAENSRLVFAHKSKTIYEAAIQTSIEMAKISTERAVYYLEKAFTYTEKSKAILLLSGIKDTEARLSVGIPQDLLENELNLRAALHFLEKKIGEMELGKRGETEVELREMKAAYFTKTQEYEAVIEQFEAEYPAYFELKFDLKTIPVSELQRQLEDHQVMLSFFIGEAAIYRFAIDSERFEVDCLSKPDDFDEQVEEWMEAIDDLSRKAFIRGACELYNCLLEGLNIPDTSTLIFIPDGSLHYMPFEALLTRQPEKQASFKELPYLVKSHPCLYHYSATLYCHKKRQQQQAGNEPYSFLGFAPVYHSGNTSAEATLPARSSGKQQLRSLRVFGKEYQPLPFSEEEVTQIATLFEEAQLPVSTYFHQDATIDNFKQMAGDFTFVHIAAHGLFNRQKPEMSGIIFSPANDSVESEKVVFYIADAYYLQLKAKIVVLSSCESGIGKLAIGEGMIAINRGFLHSGAENILYTLFKVYDQSTCRLTQRFYRYILHENLNFPQALREAKMEMIQEDVPPKHWCGFVLVGN